MKDRIISLLWISVKYSIVNIMIQGPSGGIKWCNWIVKWKLLQYLKHNVTMKIVGKFHWKLNIYITVYRKVINFKDMTIFEDHFCITNFVASYTFFMHIGSYYPLLQAEFEVSIKSKVCFWSIEFPLDSYISFHTQNELKSSMPRFHA